MSIVKRHSPLAVVLVAGAALSLAACNKEDSTRTAIHKASVDLGAVSSGATTAATNSHQQTLFDGASKSAQGAGGTGASAAAANLISATATEGKAGVADGSARTSSGGAELSEDGGEWKVTEIGLFNRLSSLRSHLAQYVNHKQIASAAALYNPAEQIAALDTTSAKLESDSADRAKAKADLEAQIAVLVNAVKLKNEAAAKLDEKAGNLRKTLSGMTATNAAPVVEEAAGLKRQADRLRQDAQLVDADATQLRSQLPELQLAVAQIESQKKGIVQTKADFAEKMAFNAAQATKSNADAAKVAAAIEEEVADLKKAREGAWTTANDGRLSLLRQALGTAQKASTDAPLQSKLTVGSIQQAIGDVHLSQAVESRTYGQLMQMLATSNPALPKANDYKVEAENAAKARDDAATAAKEAYEAAKAAYATAPVRGSKESADVKARLEKLGASLDAVIQALSSGSNASLKEFGFSDAPMISVPKSEAPADKEPPVAAAAAAVPPELVALIEAYVAADTAGDAEKITSLTKATTPAAQQVLAMQASLAKLDAACKAKFDAKFSDTAKSMGMPMGLNLEGIDAGSLKIQVDGDNASTKVGPITIGFVKDGSDWKVDGDGLAAQFTSNPMMAAALPKLGPALEAAAADVESGKIASMQMLMPQLMSKLAPGGGRNPAPDK